MNVVGHQDYPRSVMATVAEENMVIDVVPGEQVQEAYLPIIVTSENPSLAALFPRRNNYFLDTTFYNSDISDDEYSAAEENFSHFGGNDIKKWEFKAKIKPVYYKPIQCGRVRREAREIMKVVHHQTFKKTVRLTLAKLFCEADKSKSEEEEIIPIDIERVLKAIQKCPVVSHQDYPRSIVSTVAEEGMVIDLVPDEQVQEVYLPIVRAGENPSLAASFPHCNNYFLNTMSYNSDVRDDEYSTVKENFSNFGGNDGKKGDYKAKINPVHYKPIQCGRVKREAREIKKVVHHQTFKKTVWLTLAKLFCEADKSKSEEEEIIPIDIERVLKAIQKCPIVSHQDYPRNVVSTVVKESMFMDLVPDEQVQEAYLPIVMTGENPSVAASFPRRNNYFLNTTYYNSDVSDDEYSVAEDIKKGDYKAKIKPVYYKPIQCGRVKREAREIKKVVHHQTFKKTVRLALAKLFYEADKSNSEEEEIIPIDIERVLKAIQK